MASSGSLTRSCREPLELWLDAVSGELFQVLLDDRLLELLDALADLLQFRLDRPFEGDHIPRVVANQRHAVGQHLGQHLAGFGVGSLDEGLQVLAGPLDLLAARVEVLLAELVEQLVGAGADQLIEGGDQLVTPPRVVEAGEASQAVRARP